MGEQAKDLKPGTKAFATRATNFSPFVLLFLLATALVARAAPAFKASLDRNTISLGETVTLSLAFEDCAPQGEPTLPPMSGLEFSGGGSSQQQFSFENGRSTQSTTYTFELRPTRAGDFTIPALTADTDQGQLTSGPLHLRVVRGNIPQPAGVPETAFVRIVPATNSVYIGETIPVDLQCYCQDNVGNIQLPQFTSDSFIIGNVPSKPGQSHVRVGNVMYTLFNFRVPVTATRTGTLSLGPATWGLTVYSGQRTIFGWSAARQGSFTSDTPEINSLPIPTAGAPADFRGAIGDFTLAQCEAGPTTLGVGDPVTLKIRIEGQGSFDTVTLPASQPDWREFKTYPPTAKFDTSDPLQIEGSKYFEQVITPLNAQVTQIPPFSFSFFNPGTSSFHTLTHPAIPLSVHPTAATPQPTIIASGAPSPDAQQQNQDIVHIKPLPGRIGMIEPPLIRQPLYLMLQTIAPLAWICALLWRQQKDKLAANPRLRRRREVARSMREGLADLSQLAAANDVEKFYSTVLRLLQEQLGERLDLPAPAITEAVLEDCKGLDAAAAVAARDLFHACEQYRYTPEHTAQELASLIPKVKTALDVLQNIPDPDAGRRRTLVQGAGSLLLLASVLSARADPVSLWFEQANKSYEEGHYAEAAAAYRTLLQHGCVSPAIYFNTGNAWFKAGQIGRAIYYYRRAEELAPRDPDIRANLQIARTQAGTNTASLPGNRWTRWLGRLTLNEWTVAAAMSVAVFFLVLTARQISPRFNRSAGGLTISLAVLSLWLLACLGLSIDQRLLEQSSIVIVPEAVVRRGPMDESQSAFTVHDGAELPVLARDGNWLQVIGASRQTGWLPQQDVALMP
ncbi:MAG TPA: BatD family protein [Candidatus Baltobacteraceae bacterium]|nr:BatD family protein [Candidatus Baltobacteraceae bacterium]